VDTCRVTPYTHTWSYTGSDLAASMILVNV
jgi:hypothetical protein